MRGARRSLLAACALALASCADEPLTSEYDLAGYVTVAGTGNGVSGVEVRFTSETSYTESTTTDDDGHYQMRVETDSPYGQVRAEREGFSTEQETVYFDTRARRVDLELQPAP